MINSIKKHYKFVLALTAIIILNILIYLIGVNEIVDKIGATNAYIIGFIIALVAGFSVFSSSIFYSTYIALALSGINFLILGLVAGIGLIIGDMLFYFMVTHGMKTLPDKWQTKSKHFGKWINKKPSALVPIIVLIYSAFIPLSNDFLLVTLAAAEQSIKKMFPLIVIGDITLATIVAYTAQKGIELFW